MGYDVIERIQTAAAKAAAGFSPEMAGASSTDADHSPVFNTIAAAHKHLRLDGSRYTLKPTPGAISGLTPQPAVLLSNGQHLDGQGATLSMPNGGRGFAWRPDLSVPDPKSVVSGNVAAGDVALTLAVGGGATFAVGDTVLWRLGDLVYDTAETLNWSFAQVVSKAGDVVTLDRPIPFACTVASQTYNKHLVKPSVFSGGYFHDYTIDGGTGVEDGHGFVYARRSTFERIHGKFCGAGLFVFSYSEDLTFRQCGVHGANLTQLSYGSAFAFAECRAINLHDCYAIGALYGVKCEMGSHAMVENFHFVNTIPYVSGTRPTVLLASGTSTIRARNLSIEGYGGYVTATISNGQSVYDGTVTVENLRSVTDTDPWQLPQAVRYLTGLLDLTIGGVRQQYDMRRRLTWERTFLLGDSESLTVLGPPGLLAEARVFTSAGLTLGAGNQLTSLYWGRSTDNGQNFVANCVAGSEIALPVFNGAVAGIQWVLRANNLQVLVVTGTGLTGSGKFIRVKAVLVPESGASTYALSDNNALRVGPVGTRSREVLCTIRRRSLPPPRRARP
jgi:hypothetical protein